MPKRKRKKRKTTSLKKRWFLLGVAAFFLFVTTLSAAIIVYVAIIINQLPPLEQFGSRKVSQSTKIYDRTGKILLYEIFGEEKRTIVSLEDIPEEMKWATLAAEDAGFYTQPAFDIKAIIRALLVNLREGKIVQGGSTITQQLVKNVFLSPERTLARKIKELVLAVELESRYSKDEIFEAYLNQIPYGSNTYGVEAAAQTFFNKSVKDLSLDEMATLASLPKAPSYYSPWGTHVDELMERRDWVLERMYELGYITSEKKEEAKKINTIEKFAPPSLGIIKAPHFSLEVRNYLIKKYGEETALNGGLKVITTLDWEIQQIAEEVVYKNALRNEELYGGRNAALIAQDPKTGQILAMVGSRNYFDKEIDGNFNVATQGLRQPGSALKPFVYLTAFSKGFHPKSVMMDVPTEFVAGDPDCPPIITPESENNKKCFNPENFDNVFRGPVTLETALAQSINLPSVKILYLAGLDDVLKTLRLFGVTTLKEKWRYGLSLVLGGGEVKLIELVNAYATLAEEGIKHKQVKVLKIIAPDGEVLESYKDEKERVFDPQSVRIINQILSDKQLRSGLFQNSLGLTVFPGREVALKTGTTNDYRDAWAIGYTPNLVVGVWAGNNDNKPMYRQGSSILAALPMWSEFLNRVFVLENYQTADVFKKPDPTTLPSKPMLNGKEIFTPIINGQSYPQLHSILFWADKKDPLGPVPASPGSDPQFYNWEMSVINWAKQNIPGFLYSYNKPLPSNIDLETYISQQAPIPKNDDASLIKIIYPKNGSFVMPPLIVSASIESKNGLSNLKLYFNGSLKQSLNIKGNTYNYLYYISDPLIDQNVIKIEVSDLAGNTDSTSIIVFRK